MAYTSKLVCLAGSDGADQEDVQRVFSCYQGCLCAILPGKDDGKLWH